MKCVRAPANLLDRVDVDVIVHQDRPSQWRVRVQLWNSERNQTGSSPVGTAQGTFTQSSRGTSLAVSSTNTQTSQHSSTMSFQTKASQVTAVKSLMESDSDRRSIVNIDAATFEPPKQPLLVLFLRPRPGALPLKQHLSLMRISSMSNQCKIPCTKALTLHNCSGRKPSQPQHI